MELRFTKEVIQKLLAINEGFKAQTYRKSRNKEEENHYQISNGKLIKRSIGKTSWADSKYDNTVECDIDQTRRFLKEHVGKLNLSI